MRMIREIPLSQLDRSPLDPRKEKRYLAGRLSFE
jgi:hypothetical protein